MHKERDNLWLLVTGLMVAGMMTFTGCDDDEREEPAPRDIVDVISLTPNLSTLASAIEVGKLNFTLRDTGPYTILAPSNDAFENLPDGLLRALLNNPEKLSDLVLYHTLAGSISSTNFTTGSAAPFYKRDGHIEIEVDGPSIILNGSSSVIGPDNEGVNGVVHVISEVLFPAEFEFPN